MKKVYSLNLLTQIKTPIDANNEINHHIKASKHKASFPNNMTNILCKTDMFIYVKTNIATKLPE